MAQAESKTTTDHSTIKQWTESRGGFPATVKSTEENGEPGLFWLERFCGAA